MYFRPAVANKRGPSLCVSEGNEAVGMLRISNLARVDWVVYSSGQITYEVTGLLWQSISAKFR